MVNAQTASSNVLKVLTPLGDSKLGRSGGVARYVKRSQLPVLHTLTVWMLLAPRTLLQPCRATTLYGEVL